MTKRERAKIFLDFLNENYPMETKSFLNYGNAFELLVATILAAQCTDDRVNSITPGLFKKYPAVSDFASADAAELEKAIYAAGFFRTKARNIIGAAIKIRDEFGGVVPKEMEDLTGLAGVGRKTANVVRSHAFDLPGVIVDTHVKRISNRLEFVESDDPVKIEYELMELLPRDAWVRYNLQTIAHGRKICRARGAKCEICFMIDNCPSAKHLNKKERI
jgi:endonuclease-3